MYVGTFSPYTFFFQTYKWTFKTKNLFSVGKKGDVKNQNTSPLTLYSFLLSFDVHIHVET